MQSIPCAWRREQGVVKSRAVFADDGFSSGEQGYLIPEAEFLRMDDGVAETGCEFFDPVPVDDLTKRLIVSW